MKTYKLIIWNGFAEQIKYFTKTTYDFVSAYAHGLPASYIWTIER